MHPSQPERVTLAPFVPPLRAAWMILSRFEGGWGSRWRLCRSTSVESHYSYKLESYWKCTDFLYFILLFGFLSL